MTTTRTGATAYAVRVGLARGWIEFRHNLTGAREQGFNLFVVAVALGAALVQSGGSVGGVQRPVWTVISALALVVLLGGLPGVGGQLAIEREDTTLLRTRAAPHGLVGLFVGRMVTVVLDTLLTMLLILGSALLLVDGTSRLGPVHGSTLLWLIPLGLVATAPVGAILGAVFARVRVAGGSAMLSVLVLSGISGIFAPITHLPEWLQSVGQVFPPYWLGLGLRSAFLPDSASAAEIDGSWRVAETVGVLGAWAAAGLLVAPAVLRWMARRQSGVDLQTRKQRALQRIG